MTEKHCYVCDKYFPSTSDFFYRDSSKYDGLMSRCKKCDKQRDEDKRNGVFIPKVKELLSPEVKKEKRSAKNRRWYERHKELSISIAKRWQRNNPERRKELAKLWYEDNKERYTLSRKKYQLAHPEKVKLQQKLHRQKRDAKKRNTFCTLTNEQWEECLRFFDYKDAYTGLPMENITQEHVMPISKGGPTSRQNIVPCEMVINAQKNNKDMETWYRAQTFFSELRLKKIHNWMGMKLAEQPLQIEMF